MSARLEPEQREALEQLASTIGEMLRKVVSDACEQVDVEPGGVGFILALFTYSPDFLTYLSTAERADAVVKLRQLADRLEQVRAKGERLVH